MANPEFSKLEDTNSWGEEACANLFLFKIIVENCIKMEEFKPVVCIPGTLQPGTTTVSECPPKKLLTYVSVNYHWAELTSDVLFWLLLQRYSQSRRPHGSWPFHHLPGTIPSFHCSNREAVNGGTASGGGSNWRLFLGTAGN